jgi:hypothetical protein
VSDTPDVADKNMAVIKPATIKPVRKKLPLFIATIPFYLSNKTIAWQFRAQHWKGEKNLPYFWDWI